jgi:DNA-3-methyladenine glycosylase II
MRLITCQADVDEGADFLAELEPRFAHALTLTGQLPLRRRKDGFEHVMHAIVGQQISVAAGNAIWKRLQGAKLTGPRKVMWASDEELRAAGLSSQKMKYVRALAAAKIDFKALRTASTQEVVETLTQVSGIGVWTAEIYAKFSLGHADVFAAGDLALVEGTRMLFDLPERPSEKRMREMAAEWSPWRSVAARLLWAYYHVEKSRAGIR